MTARRALALSAVACAAAVCAAAPRAQTERFVTNAAELFQAVQASQPGDVITMANGTWTDTPIGFNTDGVPGDSVTLRAETPGGVVLTGSSTLSIGGDYLKVDGLRFENGALQSGVPVIQFRRSSTDVANHSRLTNTTVVDYNPPNPLTEYKWVSLYGVENRVDHCYFAGKTHEGALLVVWLAGPPNDAPPAHRIDHNHFGPRPPFGANGAETIRIGTSDVSLQDANVTVERNLFTETNGEIEAISNKSGGNVYRSNTFRRMRATLTLRHGNRATVEGNYFLGENVPTTGGVRIIGEDHRVVNNVFQDLTGTDYSAALSMVQGVPNSPLNRYFQVKRPVVAHNTFVNVVRPFQIGVAESPDQSLPPEDITVVNNAVQVLLSRRILTVDLAPTGTSDWSGNVFFGQPGTFPPGVTFADPMLALAADGLYRPAASSPVVGAAAAAFAPAADMDGQPRSDGAPDSGADEVSAAPVLLGPLTAADVGPAWLLPSAAAPAAPRAAARLAPSHPNPFDSVTTVPFTLDRPAHVRLTVLDVTGRTVATLVDAPRAAGGHAAPLDGRALAAGVYLLLLEADGQADRRLVTLARSAR